MSDIVGNVDGTLMFKEGVGICAVDAEGCLTVTPLHALPEYARAQAGACFLRRRDGMDGMDTILFRGPAIKEDGYSRVSDDAEDDEDNEDDEHCSRVTGIDEYDATTGMLIRHFAEDLVWNIDDHQDFLSAYVVQPAASSQMACSGDLIAIANGGAVTFRAYSSGDVVRTMDVYELLGRGEDRPSGSHAWIRSVAFTCDGAHVILADYGNACVWKVAVAGDGCVVSQMQMPGLYVPRHVLVMADDTVVAGCWGRLWCGTPPTAGGVVSVNKDFTACKVVYRAPKWHMRPTGLACTASGAVCVSLTDGTTHVIV